MQPKDQLLNAPAVHPHHTHKQTHTHTQPERLSSHPEGRGRVQSRVGGQQACFSSCLALGPRQQRLSSKASKAGPNADTVPTMSHYPPAAAPVRAAVPPKKTDLRQRAKVNLAVRLRWRAAPRPCVTENRLGGINATAPESVDRGVCVSVCVSAVHTWLRVDDGKLGRCR